MIGWPRSGFSDLGYRIILSSVFVQTIKAERRINEVHRFPCLKIETWATHHLWADLGHPPVNTIFLESFPFSRLIIKWFPHSNRRLLCSIHSGVACPPNSDAEQRGFFSRSERLSMEGHRRSQNALRSQSSMLALYAASDSSEQPRWQGRSLGTRSAGT
jgi:hypothetical protein